MLREELEDRRIALTAVYLKLDAEYFGFIEELPRMNSRGRTLFDTRAALQQLAAEVFAEERRTVAEAHTANSMIREPFFLRSSARKSRRSAPGSMKQNSIRTKR